MLVLDFVRETSASNPSILLPRFHSGHLGFVPGTRVHVATPTKVPQGSDRRTEVLVTPFQTTPDGTALISVVLHDAIGVVRSLVQALSWLNINIEVQESSSIDHLDLHRVGMIVDLGEANLPTGTTSERMQSQYRDYAANVPIHSKRFVQLFDMIVALCGDALWWHDYEEGRRIPALYVRPLPKRDELNPSSVILDASPDASHTEIRLPSDVARHIQQRLEIDPGATDEVSYLFVSDTNDRTLRSFFLPKELADCLVHVGISHSDRPGTLARVLDVVAAAQFNIVTSLLRKHSEGTSVWEAVLDYRGVDDKPPSKPGARPQLPSWYREELVPWVHGKLVASPQIRQVAGCHVAIGPPLYPKDCGGKDPENRMELSPGGKRTADPPKPTNAEMMTFLEQRRTDLDDAPITPEEHLVSAGLLEAVATHRRRIRQRTLFLSYPKTGAELVDSYLRRVLTPPDSPSYHLTDYQISKPPTIPEQVIALIHEADYFLAIWHPENDKDGRRRNPAEISPWMYFEYGIALAAGKPLVLACHTDLEDVNPRRLVGNNGLIMYDDANFAAVKVKEIKDACTKIFKDTFEARFNDDPPAGASRKA